MKVLLDTDIGTDIDDAVCLAYLLAQPDCELLGITTVTGEPVKRAQMASALCHVAGKDIPIYPGASQPLLVSQNQPDCPQAAALTRWPHSSDFPEYEAVNFLRRTIRAHPGEVTLLTIGPLTNVALLFALDPECAGLLKALVMMVGVFAPPLPAWGSIEWNAHCDPHAAAMVYRAAPTIHRSIGLDVTTQVTMHAAEVRERFQTPLLRPVLDFAEVWFEKRDHITFHDPLAAAVLFDDDICMFTRGQVDVEMQTRSLWGKMHFSAGDGPHEVALKVDAERFFDHYFGVVTQAGL